MVESTTRSMSPATRAQLKQLWVLIITSCVDMIGFAIVLPLMPFYALKFNATPEQIGLLVASFSISQLLFSPFWGRFSDRYGRRPALLIGLSASAIAYVVFAFSGSLWLLFLSRIIQGAGGGTTGVVHAYVGDTIRASDRAKALGWLSAASALGVMLGPVIGSFATHFGHEVPGIIAAVLCVVNVTFAWRWLVESRKPGSRPPQKKPVWHAAWVVVRHPQRPVSRFVWIYGAGMLGFSAMTAVLALYLNEKFGVDERNIGYVFLYVGALGLVMRTLILGPAVDRLGETGVMRLGTVALSLGLLLYPLPSSLGMLAVVIPLVPIGTALLFPATTALMSRVSNKEELGLTMGVAQTFAGIARVIAPLVATSAFQRFGPPTPFYLAGGVVALVGVLAFRVLPPVPSQPTPAEGIAHSGAATR
ncbi:MAG TPA: MFS transporter [Gemmatimonadales bacterium]|nr:MFS transporter [Gemmatimonadales bacterium]